MIDALERFHFLRPAGLLLLLPMAWLVLALYRKAASGANWRRAIAPDLIDYLLEPGQQQRRHWLWLLALAWLLATVALAGPTWEQIPQPALQKRDALVIVLDLSLSMYADDIKPSRLQRARYKIFDILKQRREGLTGLVVYSGDAHIVAPLTDDTATIANLVPALAPAMMPSLGSNANAGIEQAIQLLRNAGFERGRILLISDDIDDSNSAGIASQLANSAWQLSIIGVGTEQGAPIPVPSGYLKNPNGSIAVAQLHRRNFQALAQKINARYSDLRLDDGDINALLPDSATATTRTLQREFDQWRERGPQLVMLLLPLAALAFRRGWLLAVLLLPLSAPSRADSWSEQWRSLWQRPDQQAQRLFDAGNSRDAAQKFADPGWRAAAQYRSGDYEHAAQTLAGQSGADAQYNRGNALAQAGKLQDAIAAYDAALQQDPALDDAKFNRELVKKMLQQQQQNKSQQGNGSPQQSASAQQQRGDQQQDGEQNSGAGSQANSQENSQDSSRNNSQDDSRNNPQQKSADQQASANKNSSADRSGEETPAKNAAKPESQTDAGSARAADSARQNAAPDKNRNEKNSPQTAADDSQPSAQQLQQRATEQWLRQIPDDPAGLLRRKFLYEYRQRQRDPATRDEPPTW